MSEETDERFNFDLWSLAEKTSVYMNRVRRGAYLLPAPEPDGNRRLVAFGVSRVELQDLADFFRRQKEGPEGERNVNPEWRVWTAIAMVRKGLRPLGLVEVELDALQNFDRGDPWAMTVRTTAAPPNTPEGRLRLEVLEWRLTLLVGKSWLKSLGLDGAGRPRKARSRSR